MTCKQATWAGIVGLSGLANVNGAVLVDILPGTGAPPGTLGGYTMGAFSDLTPEGTTISSLTPPPGFPGSGDLLFSSPVEHMKAGGLWDTWSHGYAGDVYSNLDNDLLMLLPTGTLAFYLYIQPNLKAVFEFRADSSATVTTLNIDGNGGARYVGFYTDDPLAPLQYVYVEQTTMDSDGFAVGELAINVIPEPGACAAFAALALLGLGVWRKMQN